MNSAKERIDLQMYLRQMDACIGVKYGIFSALIRDTDKMVLDVGTGTGLLPLMLAKSFPNTKFIGIDADGERFKDNIQASRELTNLNYIGTELNDLRVPRGYFDAIIFSSSLHEIYSYNSGISTIIDSLRRAYSLLKPGGRMIIRDFIRPKDIGPVVLKQLESDIVKGHSFPDLVSSITYPPMTLDKTWFPLDWNSHGDWKVYKTDMASAFEYIYRKDYHEAWDSELTERYGFWSEEEARNLLESAGFILNSYNEMNSPWIESNRFEGKIKIYDLHGRLVNYPSYKAIILASKPEL